MTARRFIVRGRVQRVGFRLFVEDAARIEGLTGFVRNRHDGSVEIVAEGDVEAMTRFEYAVRRGPAGARVEDVDTTDLPVSGQYRQFAVTGT